MEAQPPSGPNPAGAGRVTAPAGNEQSTLEEATR